MTRDKALQIVQEAFMEHEYLHPDSYTFDDTLKSLGIDSLDKVEIGIVVEDKLHCSFPDSVFNSINTVKDFVDLVEKQNG